MSKTIEINKFLFRKNNFYHSSIKKFNKIDIVLKTVSGHKEIKRSMFAQRISTTKLKWLKDHILEIYLLVRQIGLFNTLRFLKYASSPKILYIDFIKCVSIDEKDSFFYSSETGFPLQNYYSKNDIINYKLKSIKKNNFDDCTNYDLKKIIVTSKKLKIYKNLLTRKKDGDNSSSWIIAGAGNFATSMLIPSIVSAGGKLEGICSYNKISAEIVSNLYNITNVYDSFDDLLNSKSNNLLIATPPYLHTQQIISAIKKGKKIYSEKPVCISYDDINKLLEYKEYKNCMIGFNRRFSPTVEYLMNSDEYNSYSKEKSITYIVQLGEFSISMATRDIGGGSTIGSCCHYLDLIEYVARSKIVNFQINKINDCHDGYSFSCVCRLENDEIATLVFIRTGKHAIGIKERFIITGDGINVEIQDFEKIILNKKKKFYFKNPKGLFNGIKYFQKTDLLLGEKKIPTLADAIRISKITLNIDSQLNKNN